MNFLVSFAALFSIIFLIIMVVYKSIPEDFESFKRVWDKLPEKAQMIIFMNLWNSLDEEEQKDVLTEVKGKEWVEKHWNK